MKATNTEVLELALQRPDAPPRRATGAGRPIAGRARGVDAAWAALPEAVPLSVGAPRSCLERARQNPGAVAGFDLLRTRLVRALGARGWRRVAVTGPGRGAGSTFVTANLAASLSRLSGVRSLALDLDLRAPRLAAALGLRPTARIKALFDDTNDPGVHLARVGESLAVGLNDRAEADAAEQLLRPGLARGLDAVSEMLRPDVILLDLPPVLVADGVMAVLPHVDGVLLVADGHSTTGAQIAECEALLSGQTPLLGVLLNRAEGARAMGNGNDEG